MFTEAALLHDASPELTLTQVRLDDPTADEVVVAVTHVGVCHSDLHYVTGRFGIARPAVLGHEMAGVVERVGTGVTSLTVGDRVVAALSPSCGRCASCQAGRSTICENTERMRSRVRPALTLGSGRPIERLAGVGAFARHVLMRENALAKLPADVPSHVGCLLGCCVLTGLGAVFHAARVRPGSSVAVVGCGGVGSAIVQGARIAGAGAVIALDVDDKRLESAIRFGASATVNSATQEPLAAVLAEVPGGVDYAFEAVGSGQTVEAAFGLLRPGGIATVVGLAPEGTHVSVPASALFFEEKRLIGSYMGSSQFHRDVVEYSRLYRNGSLLLDEMVSDILPFDRINDALSRMQGTGITRLVLEVK